jgi:hypothetical protein
MREQEEGETEEEPRSPWEEATVASLTERGLPIWDNKSKAATFVQGHRGLLDVDLDFPKEYLKEPAPLCYVWKVPMDDGFRVHVYADINGGCFHLVWEEESSDGPQNQPVHAIGHCGNRECEPCKAADHLIEQLASRPA